jgi:hypothetical protein
MCSDAELICPVLRQPQGEGYGKEKVLHASKVYSSTKTCFYKYKSTTRYHGTFRKTNGTRKGYQQE